MPFTKRHRLHAISLPGAPGTLITQLTENVMAKNFNSFREHSTGEEAPQHSGATMSSPGANFATPSIKLLLDEVNGGQQGLCRAYESGTVSIYYRAGVKRGLRDLPANTVHHRFDAVNNAFLFWDNVGGVAGELASIAARLQFVSDDGDTTPLVSVGAVALAGASATDDHFVVGPVIINGTVVDADLSWQLDNQLVVDEAIDAGSQFRTYSAIEMWQPMLTVESSDLSLEPTYGEVGLPITSLEFYLRKQLKNGLLVPKATAQHIKFTASAGTIFIPQSAGQTSTTTVELLIDKPDATTPPFTIDTASIIP